MIKKYKIIDRKIIENGFEDASIFHFSNPDDKEKEVLVRDFKLDAHTMASALDPDEPSRIEFESDHIALIFKLPKNYSAEDHFLFKVVSMGLFLYRNRLIILTSENSILMTDKIFSSVDTMGDVFLKLIYSSIRHYLEHLKVINMTTDNIEKKISMSMENSYLLNLFSLEKSLVYYLNAISSNGFVFEKLRNFGAKNLFVQINLEYLEDIIIENSQCYRQAEIYSNILASLMDARVSIVSNNLNILMKNLNLITIGIMVPTLVVSAFSMNVFIPLQKHPYAFWIIIFFAAASVAGVLLWWKYASSNISKRHQ